MRRKDREKHEKIGTENEKIEKEQIEIRKLEEMYVNGTVEEMLSELDRRKEELIDKMVKYAKENEVACKWDKDGKPIDYEVEIKPVVINHYFFKSIIPIGNVIPKYNAEQLALAFDYYMELISDINVYIGAYPSSLVTFCKFLGISLSTLRTYRNSPDINMRNIVEKIYDQIGEENLTMSQMGVSKEKSTMFRLKTQNEIVEKTAPNIKINYNATINKEDMEDKLEKYKSFLSKREE